MKQGFVIGLLLPALTLVHAKCYDPAPSFPVPTWDHDDFKNAFRIIEQELEAIVQDEKYNKSSFSVEITSSSATLFSQFHTAAVLNDTRPGDSHVDGGSLYRVASISKTFTVLGLLQLQKAGDLNLDDTVLQHIPELDGELPWKDITLRVLASQLAGLPRDWASSDLLLEVGNPLELGLPPASGRNLPACGQSGGWQPCSRKQMLDYLKRKKPLFAPNQKSSYSNIAFELLGLVIENVTGLNFTDYMQQEIFDTIGMNASTLRAPESDDHAVLPAIGFNFWDVDMGIQNPAGGIYSSSSDMSKYMRYILTHFNTLATGVNWLMPASWSTGLNTFYGMPFEIYRTANILKDSGRPVTFVTKSGGLPGYYSLMVLVEEYGLGFTILVGGNVALVSDVLEVISARLIQAAEDAVWNGIEKTYSGDYTATNTSLNSSLALRSSPSNGLTVEKFVSNGTNVFTTLLSDSPGAEGDWRAQLVPTLLYKNETTQEGEIWRLTVVNERPKKNENPKIWDDFCITDLDIGSYAGLPISEVIFWLEEGLIELPAWQLVLESKDATQSKADIAHEGLVIQG
nr:beta-lactamase-like protein [Quercus suber]